MITVRWQRAPGHLAISIDGHEFAADDFPIEPALICAAVSAIGQGLIAALEALAEQHPDVIAIEADDQHRPRS